MTPRTATSNRACCSIMFMAGPSILRALALFFVVARLILPRQVLAQKAASQPLVEARALPIVIDMGPGLYSPGSLTCLASTRDSSYTWIRGIVRDVMSRRGEDPLYADGVQGEDATLLLAVDPPGGPYRLRLAMADPAAPHGPITIRVNDRVVADSVMMTPGSRSDLLLSVDAPEGRIEVRFSAPCSDFHLCGVTIDGPRGARLGHLLPRLRKVDAMPPPEALPKADLDLRCRLLRRLSEYLIDQAPRTGGFSAHGAWYQNAYPIRTLIASGRILNEKRYSEAALSCLDAFVSRQRADGNWVSAYWGLLACDRPDPAAPTSANLADIGTMTACLAIAAPLVDGLRHDRYLAAAEAYAEHVSLPNQLSDGAFPNRRWDGRDSFHAYTVATATQTSSLSALFEATCNPRYLEASEKGAGWLARATFLPDGRIAFHPHDRDTVLVLESTSFGDVFYVADALLQVRSLTSDGSLQEEIDLALDRWLFGAKGLLASTDQGYWWKPGNAWSDSKMGGIIYVLARHPHRHDDPRIETWLERSLGWMSDPNRSRLIGVMSDPGDDRGEFALPATGFSGIGVAASIDPGVLTPGWNLQTRLFAH
jgi:hypothetical protein